MDRLPAELQLRVLKHLIPNNGTLVQNIDNHWEYYLVSNSVRVCDGLTPVAKPADSLDIMRTSKAIMNDCVSLLYSSNAISCADIENANRFLDQIGERNASRITKFAFGSTDPPESLDPEIPELEDVRRILKRLPNLDELVLSGVGRGVPVPPPRARYLPYLFVPYDFESILDGHRRLIEGVVRTLGRLNGGTVYCTRHWRSTMVCRPGYVYGPSEHQSVMRIE